MHANPNESGENFFKNTNVYPVHINAAAEKCFQTQSKNNLAFENNTMKILH